MTEENQISPNFDCSKILHKCKAACCGAVPISKAFHNAHKDRVARPIDERIQLPDDMEIVSDKDGYCVFLTEENKCNVYDDRPEICRRFGDESHPCLRCPFQAKDGRIRSRQERRKLERESQKTLDKSLKRM